MTSATVNRRGFAAWTTSILAALGLSRPAQAAGAPAAEAGLGISTGEAAIHQEAVFAASAARVFHALTDAGEFEQLVILSGAIQSMALAGSPTRITADPGAPFSLFGGYITGRNVEMTPGRRIVQAWRAGSWPPHAFSIASFELIDQPGGCKLVFEHRGFPADAATSLAKGWREHYWAPLAQLVGQA